MNNDLISRSALERELLDKGFYPAIVRAAVNKAPAVDAVSVVRCKDCKYSGYDIEYDSWWCNRSLGSFRTGENNFCSYGVKMDKEVGDSGISEK